MRSMLAALVALFAIGTFDGADAQRYRERDAYERRSAPERSYGQRYYDGRYARQRYRWCANYGPRIGATNCYFATLGQCRAAVSGVGGFCSRSPYLD